jgi:mono/diheme cytochrome c family protein
VVDAKGKTFDAPIDPAGNFSFRPTATNTVTFPIEVNITAGGRERIMGEKAPNGDCNACHTVNGSGVDGGNKAPGRIMLP